MLFCEILVPGQGSSRTKQHGQKLGKCYNLLLRIHKAHWRSKGSEKSFSKEHQYHESSVSQIYLAKESLPPLFCMSSFNNLLNTLWKGSPMLCCTDPNHRRAPKWKNHYLRTALVDQKPLRASTHQLLKVHSGVSPHGTPSRHTFFTLGRGNQGSLYHLTHQNIYSGNRHE